MAKAKIRFSKCFSWWDVYVLDEKRNIYNMVLHHMKGNDIEDLKESCQKEGCTYEEVVEI